MAIVCPTVTAYDLTTFQRQLKIVSGLSHRIHLDFMDGVFTAAISPGLDKIHLPDHIQCDLHLMYQKPMDHLKRLIALRPNMVIIHNEAEVHHMHFAAALHKEGIQVGLAVLQDTSIEWAEQIMHSFDQVLIFSGHLGHHGGVADMNLLHKVAFVRERHPQVEIAWDGGVNFDNALQLAQAGVSVLNIGGSIQNASQPREAYATLTEIVEQSTK